MGQISAETDPNRILRSLRTVSLIFHIVIFAVVSKVAPEPYIDEIFHVPQAQAYCRGDFSTWNDKITTPPGLYFFRLQKLMHYSYLLSVAVARLCTLLWIPFDLCSTEGLRLLNLLLLCGALPLITRRLYQHIHAGASEQTLILASVLPTFPLLSFFGNLYYTDVLSTTLVLYCYLLALQRRFISSSMVRV